MDPEGAGKKKAEDFEKGLEGFGVGSARGDVMQRGRGAVQITPKRYGCWRRHNGA